MEIALPDITDKDIMEHIVCKECWYKCNVLEILAGDCCCRYRSCMSVIVGDNRENFVKGNINEKIICTTC